MTSKARDALIGAATREAALKGIDGIVQELRENPDRCLSPLYLSPRCDIDLRWEPVRGSYLAGVEHGLRIARAAVARSRR